MTGSPLARGTLASAFAMPDPHAAQSAAHALRTRLVAALAAGRSVALSAEEMADPEVRRELPALLAGLAGTDAVGVVPGLQLPGYTVLGAIGHGGMSTVYLARQERLGRCVALKVAAWSGADRRTRERLVQEARALARVAHPNIVAIHDIVDVGETVAIALDWIDGLTLEALLRVLPAQPGPDDMRTVREQLGAPPTAAAIFEGSPVRFFVVAMEQVARAVHRVHESGLLHLDIKPSNVLVRRDGTPLLADFGVVREIDLQTTKARTFAGTPIYCAPEQLRRDDRGFGPHTDVYGLGITLYEVLARRQPLRDQDLTRLVQTIERGRIPPLGTQIPIAKDLETIVQKAMAPSPGQRYPTAAALADDLQAFLEGRPVAARPLSRVQRLQRWAQLEPWKAALAVVLLVTLPMVAYLSIELVLGQPHIEAGRLRERQRQALQLEQTAYRQRLTGEIDAKAAAALLDEAMALDPSDKSLACLASMTADDNPDAVAPLLARHEAAVARSVGLQWLARKASERRPFFTAAEVRELKARANPTDWHVLVLDRVLWAEDLCVEDAFLEAAQLLTEAMIGAEPDPLLLGLHAWVAALAEERELRNTTCRWMRSLWPDSEDVVLWECTVYEPDEPEAVIRVAEDWLARDASSVAAWELRVGVAYRSGDHAAGLALAERAQAVPVASPRLAVMHASLLAANGHHERARQLLAARPDCRLNPLEALRLSRLQGGAAWRAYCDELLAAPHVPRLVLSSIVRDANRHRDSELGRRAFERFEQDYPGYRNVWCYEMQRRYRDKDILGAAQLARQIALPRCRVDADGAIVCGLLVAARDWRALADCADRWWRYGSEATHAHAAFFAGLAASRLGEPAAAVTHLAVATVAAQSSAWYASALLERAWVLVAPTTPLSLRDPELARLLLDRFRTANDALQSPRRGPWIAAVTAEVLFANGRVEEALAMAQAGLDAAGDPRMAPPADYRELLQSAPQRYRR